MDFYVGDIVRIKNSAFWGDKLFRIGKIEDHKYHLIDTFDETFGFEEYEYAMRDYDLVARGYNPDAPKCVCGIDKTYKNTIKPENHDIWCDVYKHYLKSK